MSEIKTTPEMNVNIKQLLRLGNDRVELYAALRIEELESENNRLLKGFVDKALSSTAGQDLLTRMKEMEGLLKVTDQILATRNELLSTIPECTAHGIMCVPHAIEWVKESIEIRSRVMARDEEIKRLREALESAKEELENIIGYPAVEKLAFYDQMISALGGDTPCTPTQD